MMNWTPINFDEDYKLVIDKLKSDFGWDKQDLADADQDLLNDVIRATKEIVKEN